MKAIARICIVSLGFIVPTLTFNFDVASLLSVASFLFAILAGFFIAAATSNYLRHQSLIAQENSALITLAHLVRKIQPSSFEAVADAIDTYLISSLDYDLLTYHKGRKEEFNALMAAIDSVVPRDTAEAALYQNLHNSKSEIVLVEQESFLTAKTITSPLHWFVISVLAALTSLLILVLRDGSLVSSFMSGFLILGIIEVLELIYAIDTNVFLATKLAFESPQSVFTALGRLNYYPEFAVKKKSQKELPDRYRMGVYKNYPDSMKKKIIVVSKKKNKRS